MLLIFDDDDDTIMPVSLRGLPRLRFLSIVNPIIEDLLSIISTRSWFWCEVDWCCCWHFTGIPDNSRLKFASSVSSRDCSPVISFIRIINALALVLVVGGGNI